MNPRAKGDVDVLIRFKKVGPHVSIEYYRHGKGDRQVEQRVDQIESAFRQAAQKQIDADGGKWTVGEG